MKKYACVLVCFLLAGSCRTVLGQTGNESSDLEKILSDASEQWLCIGPHQKPHKDCVEFRKKYWVDQFFEINETGIVQTKDEILAKQSAANPAPGTGPFPDDFRLKAVYGDFAMTVDRTAFKTLDSKSRLAFTSDAKVLRLFVREDGQWRPAGAAMVPIIPPPISEPPARNNGAKNTGPNAQLEKELTQIDQKWMDPTTGNQDKMDYLKQLFTDQWYEILGWNPTAQETKLKLLDSLAKRKSEPGLGIFSDEFKLMAVYGSVALATDRRTRKALDVNGHVVSTPHRCLLVFVKEGQEWRSAGGAVVPIMQTAEH